MTREELTKSKKVEGFDTCTIVQKLETINYVLDEKIRFFLQQDGGDLLVIEIKDNDVYIRYTGACHGCGGADGTLMAVQSILRENISDSINVHST